VPPAPGTPEPGPVRVRLDRGWMWVAVTPGTHAQAPVEVLAGAAPRAGRGGGGGVRLNPGGFVLVRAPPRAPPVPGSASAATWERSLPEPQEVLVPPSGPPAPNRPLTRDLAENSWAIWNEEQDYVAYGGKQPVRN